MANDSKTLTEEITEAAPRALLVGGLLGTSSSALLNIGSVAAQDVVAQRAAQKAIDALAAADRGA